MSAGNGFGISRHSDRASSSDQQLAGSSTPDLLANNRRTAFQRFAVAAVVTFASFTLSPVDCRAQQGTVTLSGTVSGSVYNRDHNPMRYVARGQFRFTIVATRYTYRNGILTIHDGQIWMNGPVSAVFYGVSGSFGPRGGKVSSRQTAYRNGKVNQATISTSNLGSSLNITGWNVSFNQYVAPR